MQKIALATISVRKLNRNQRRRGLGEEAVEGKRSSMGLFWDV
jgi:hypothetical protein